MASNSSQKISLSIAKKILAGFERHYQNIKSASIEAKRCFEEREWEKIEKDSKLRLKLLASFISGNFCPFLAILHIHTQLSFLFKIVEPSSQTV